LNYIAKVRLKNLITVQTTSVTITNVLIVKPQLIPSSIVGAVRALVLRTGLKVPCATTKIAAAVAELLATTNSPIAVSLSLGHCTCNKRGWVR
jgi:hypothetical protein